MSIIVIFPILIWQNAKSLNQIDIAHRQLETPLYSSGEKMVAKVYSLLNNLQF